MNKKMNLKKIKKINFNIFNNKSFLIFLVSLFVIGIVIGIIFFNFLDSRSFIKFSINSLFMTIFYIIYIFLSNYLIHFDYID